MRSSSLAADTTELLGFVIVVSVVEAPVYEAAAVFLRCRRRQGGTRPRQDIAGDSRRSSEEVKDEAGRSVALEVHGDVTVHGWDWEYASEMLE